MAKHFVEMLETLESEGKVRIEIASTPVLIIHDAGEVYAVNDRCPHMRASLYKGDYEAGVVTCKKHNAEIDVKTGEILKKAHLGPIKMPTRRAKTYNAFVEDGKVFVEI